MSKILLQIGARFFGVLLALAPIAVLAQSGPVPNSLGITYSGGNPLLAVPAGVGMAWGGGAFIDQNGNLTVTGCSGCAGGQTPMSINGGNATSGAWAALQTAAGLSGVSTTATCSNVTIASGLVTAAANGSCGSYTDNPISATSYTFSNSDCGYIDRFTASTPVVATIPTGLNPGCVINGVQDGAGQVQLAQGSGLSLKSFVGGAASNIYVSGQYGTFFIEINTGATAANAGGNLIAGAYNVNNTCANFQGSAGTTNSCSLTNPAAGGDTVVIFSTSFANQHVTSATDDKSDTCTVEAARDQAAGSLYGNVVVCANVTAGAQTFTLTLAGSTNNNMKAQEIGNVATSPIDVAGGAGQSSPGTGANAVTASVTTTASGDIVLAGIAQDTGSKTSNPGTGYASIITNATEYIVQSAAGAIAATFTQTGTGAGNTLDLVVALKHR